MKFTDVTGEKYGKLKVLGYFRDRDSRGRSVIRLRCLCDCGKECSPCKEKVVAGQTRSCGCLLEETRSKLGERMMKNPGEAAFNEVFGSYKKGANVRNYEFSLSKTEFLDIIIKPCLYCGSILTNEHSRNGSNGFFKYTGIDRYDNKIGYTIDNSVPCCRVCNRMKTDMGVDVLYEHLNKMLDNSNVWKRTA